MKLCLTLLAGPLLGIMLLAGAARADDQVKIAIADPTRIAQNIKETKDLLDKMRAQQQDLVKQEKDRKDEIDNMKQQLTLFDANSPQYKQKEEDLLKKSIEFDAWEKETAVSLQRQQKSDLTRLFNKIEEAIAQVAKGKGINLVLADQRPQIPDNLEQVDIRTLQAIIGQRTILYSDQKFDISGDVITILDKNYAGAH